MNLRFQMGREDALAFNRAFQEASPTYRRTRARSSLMLPAVMLIVWIFSILMSGFDWIGAAIYLGFGFLWYLFFPAYYQNRVERYCAKVIDEGSYKKNFGEYTLILSDEGVHSNSPTGTSDYTWESIDRAMLTDSHLFIFLNGPAGYPVGVEDIGSEVAQEALDYINAHLKKRV